jgi:glycosyltransferase involved in cell wall biosynthesis
MHPHTPQISVILPIYNASEYLVPAVESILSQGHSDFELLICDDGSNDGSTGIIRDFEKNDDRIRVIYWSSNQGITSALNALIDLARGTYLACMNADDISMPDRLAVQLETFRQVPGPALLSGACDLIDSRGGRLRLHTPPLTNLEFHMRFRCPMVHPLYFTCTSLIRSFKYREVLYAEDYDLVARMMKAGVRLLNIEQPLLQYRLHETNLGRPDKAFMQLTASMWIRNQIRDKQKTEAGLAGLEAFRSRFDYEAFLNAWPVYARCLGKGERDRKSGFSLLANYSRFDPLMRAEVRNSFRYRVAMLFR